MPSILSVSFLSCCPCIVSTMVCCAAWGCSNRSEKGVRMYGFPADMERRKKWLSQVSRSNLNINTNYNNKNICEVIIFKCICIFSQRTPQWEKYLLKIRNEQSLAKPRELIFIVRVRSYCRESSVLPITVPLTTMWYVQYVGRPKKRELCVETKLKSLCRHILRQTNLSWTKISRVGWNQMLFQPSLCIVLWSKRGGPLHHNTPLDL